ncbi:hypothetical protein [Croceicoccus sp. YJ47]|uniref:hypothetical protein n=1 Tax=Croceicoccus sp. YJ47 TaxID=2798724 RepID=UPI001921B61D|nr:hypothetical protein [Croceicoccus sp. YJ47]QQN73624.1 hypothetical protein JD971_12575 [Croceicoccus sp. YJ47]
MSDLNLWDAVLAFEELSIDLKRIEHTTEILCGSEAIDERESDAFSAIGVLCHNVLLKLGELDQTFVAAHKAAKGVQP